MRSYSRTAVVAFALLASACVDRADQTPPESHTVSGEQLLGSVHLDVSCTPEAATQFQRGLALMHHMTYEESAENFAAASATDPDCAMALWGLAMTSIHPLWSDPPSLEVFDRSAATIKRAETTGTRTPLEDAFIAATAAYYGVGHSATERRRLIASSEKWREAYEQFPDNEEAIAFHTLLLLSTADPADKTFMIQLETGRLAEGLLNINSKHPGGHHYIIHSYDYPPLAEKALTTARAYGSLAPEVAHALHMPTHIFTRLGMWDDSIDFNRRAADAAKAHPAGGAVSMHYPHALDYIAYAYLQKGEDGNAEAILAEMNSIEGPIQTHLASAYTLAAVPARVALERQQWAVAASLVPRTPASYAWGGIPATEAITYFARALGNARSGNAAAARKDVAKLEQLRDVSYTSYWGRQIEIQHLAAVAWVELQAGNKEKALSAMVAAADLEGLTEKHPVTPGEVLPARELLGDMYLQLGMAQQALAAYERALERSPRRLNSLSGAAHAALELGDSTSARSYYSTLLEVAPNADETVIAVQDARKFIAAN